LASDAERSGAGSVDSRILDEGDALILANYMVTRHQLLPLGRLKRSKLKMASRVVPDDKLHRSIAQMAHAVK
jgi:hypothetical protein